MGEKNKGSSDDGVVTSAPASSVGSLLTDLLNEAKKEVAEERVSLERQIQEQKARLERIEERLEQIEIGQQRPEHNQLLSFYQTLDQEHIEMEAKIVNKPAFIAVGLSYFGKI